jgi:hypothetical protein
MTPDDITGQQATGSDLSRRRMPPCAPLDAPPLPSRWCSPQGEFPKTGGHKQPYTFHRAAMFWPKLH